MVSVTAEASISLAAMTQPPPPIVSHPFPSAPPLLTANRGYHPWEAVGIKYA